MKKIFSWYLTKLLDSSDTFFTNSENLALGFIFANKGYGILIKLFY